ncbi:KDO2-lipid IV(A) lauroyltransferase [Sphingobium sp. OAS761]|uniref:lysophospholipid acyltransferase family protein n=1 Tax=Sphingobium sp. OAS761 TaxID=2817901 RepID=UPI00209C85FA|nr:lauroyl acyltransferase [Sphingobium sp. OAS761]MCP1469792.1 KDO2-lipid IV(A) lauroyltransferase [Sphingobium sp. OAS761]
MLSNPFLFLLLRLLPASLASWIGGRLSVRFARPRMKLRDARARANLALLRPELTEAERERILTRRWENVGRTLAELANVDRLVSPRHVRVLDEPGYRSVLEMPGPMIFVAPHIGNWDLMAAHLKDAIDRPPLGVYDPPDNPRIAAQLKKARQSYMGDAITGGGGAARAILRHLARDQAMLYILLDERRDGQVWFPRFGRDLPPSGNLAFALKLARKAGARLTPFYLVRTGGPHFELHWHAPLDPGSQDDETMVAAMDAFLGKACIAHADEWLALQDMDLTVPNHAPVLSAAM